MKKKAEQTMEHVTITPVRGNLVRMTADDGYMLKNKNSRKLHKTLTTPRPERFDVVAEESK